MYPFHEQCQVSHPDPTNLHHSILVPTIRNIELNTTTAQIIIFIIRRSDREKYIKEHDLHYKHKSKISTILNFAYKPNKMGQVKYPT